MFVGHYGPSFAIKSIRGSIPLWALFIAVQLLDVGWSVLVFLGVEKVRIVPGITASNPLDLYYMPYTHSLVAAVVWAIAAIMLSRFLLGIRDWSASIWIGAAVFSHWVLDFLVHRRDLPLYDDAAKVGLGIWNYPIIALSLETNQASQYRRPLWPSYFRRSNACHSGLRLLWATPDFSGCCCGNSSGFLCCLCCGCTLA